METLASEVLWAVHETVSRFTGYGPVLRGLCRVLAETLPCDRVTIYVRSERRGGFVPHGNFGAPPDVAKRFAARPFHPGALTGQEAWDAGQAYVVELAQVDGEQRAMLEDAQLTALAVVPLRVQGEIEAAIACGMHGDVMFTAEQLDALERLSGPLALLLRNTRMESQGAQIAQRRTWLAKWAAELLTAVDVQEVAELLISAGRDLFGTTGAWLMLLEGDVLVGYRRQADGTRTPVVQIPMDAVSASVDAVRSRRVVVVNEYARSHYAQLAAAQKFKPAAVMAVPLGDGQGVIGVLMLNDADDPLSFNRMDEEDGVILGTIATAAIRKLNLVEELTRASAAKSDFLASVSHELRTPLNIIVGYAQLMAEETFGDVSEGQVDALQRILRTASDQLVLINDLLDLARIEQGKLRYNPRAINVAELVPSLEEMMVALLRDRPVRFEVAVAPEAVVSADPERLRQILVNLLGNAAKFTQAGCVRLLASLEAGGVAIAVEDTGAGIDPQLTERMLEPFVHGEGAGAGSGLGLAIVTRLLHLLQGEIAIDSTPGVGTRVTVRLPSPDLSSS